MKGAPPGAQTIANQATINDIFGREGERQRERDIQQEKALVSAIQLPEFNEACARLIAIRNLPHTLLDWPEFWAVILSVNYMGKDMIRVCRKDVPQRLRRTFTLHKKALAQKLQSSLSWIHFSIDMWTAPSKTGYQAIVASWVDAESMQAETALLSLREFRGTHGGEQQARVFLEVVEDYAIRLDRIGFFTLDNAASNDNMLRFIAEEINEAHPALFVPHIRRVRCNWHVINLAVQAFLFRGKSRASRADEDEAIKMAFQETQRLIDEENSTKRDQADIADDWRQMGALGKLHNINVWFRSSTQRYQEFVAAAGRAIPLDNDTRWNSWAKEIEAALAMRKGIRGCLDDHYDELKEDYLSHEDWQELEDIFSFLEAFLFATKDTEGKVNTLDDMLLSMDYLVQQYKEQKERCALSNHPRLEARVLASWFKFDKYYKLTDDTPIYAAAVLLHPAYRKGYFDTHWGHQRQYIEPTIKAARKLWQKHFKPRSEELTPTSPSSNIGQMENPFRRFKAQAAGAIHDQLRDEFDDFIRVCLRLINILNIC
jgi:hypothetical protein